MLLCIYVTPEEIYHLKKKAIIKYINIFKDLVKIVSEMTYNLCLWRLTLGHGLKGISQNIYSHGEALSLHSHQMNQSSDNMNSLKVHTIWEPI